MQSRNNKEEEFLNDIIEEYQLEKHPAGCGYYRENFRSPIEIYDEKLGKKRSIATQIVTLFKGDQLSPLHKTSATQLINYNSGNTTLLVKLVLENNLKTIHINKDKVQAEISPNTWFALTLEEKSEKSHVISTHTVVPGFDYEDFSFAEEKDIEELNPTDKEEAKKYLSNLCRMK